jgi:hypothetical protein
VHAEKLVTAVDVEDQWLRAVPLADCSFFNYGARNRSDGSRPDQTDWRLCAQFWHFQPCLRLLKATVYYQFDSADR